MGFTGTLKSEQPPLPPPQQQQQHRQPSQSDLRKFFASLSNIAHTSSSSSSATSPPTPTPVVVNEEDLKKLLAAFSQLATPKPKKQELSQQELNTFFSALNNISTPPPSSSSSSSSSSQPQYQPYTQSDVDTLSTFFSNLHRRQSIDKQKTDDPDLKNFFKSLSSLVESTTPGAVSPHPHLLTKQPSTVDLQLLGSAFINILEQAKQQPPSPTEVQQTQQEIQENEPTQDVIPQLPKEQDNSESDQPQGEQSSSSQQEIPSPTPQEGTAMQEKPSGISQSDLETLASALYSLAKHHQHTPPRRLQTQPSSSDLSKFFSTLSHIARYEREW